MTDTEQHEAAHAVAAIALGRPVAYVERTVGILRDGETAGRCLAPIDGRIGPSQLVIALAGYLAVDEPDWPPPWPEALDEEREALGLVLARLNPTEEQYEASIDLTRRLLADETLTRLRGSVARALSCVPRLHSSEIYELCAIHGVPVPQGDTP